MKSSNFEEKFNFAFIAYLAVTESVTPFFDEIALGKSARGHFKVNIGFFESRIFRKIILRFQILCHVYVQFGRDRIGHALFR